MRKYIGGDPNYDFRVRTGSFLVWLHSGMTESERVTACFLKQRPKNSITGRFNYVCWNEFNCMCQLTGLITVG